MIIDICKGFSWPLLWNNGIQPKLKRHAKLEISIGLKISQKSGNHLITKILLELKLFPLKHDVVLQWNEDWLVLFTIWASVELEVTDFVIVAKIIKVIFIFFHLKKSSPFFLPFTFYFLFSPKWTYWECWYQKQNIFLTSTKFLSQ